MNNKREMRFAWSASKEQVASFQIRCDVLHVMNTGSGEQDPISAAVQSDVSCLEMVGRGDERGLEQLFSAHSSLVYSVALRVLRDPSAADEVLQDVFLQIWREPGKFDVVRGSLRSWLAVVARNRSIDLLRKRKPSESIDELPLASAYDLATDVERSVMMERVRAAVKELPEEQREMLELAFFEGFTHAEIARKTGRPLGTIKTRIRRALQTLGRAFQA